MAESVIPVEGVAYSANVFDDLFVALLCGVGYSPTTQAVLRTNPWGYNTLAVTGTSSPVAVASGAAIVNGKLYKNTASVNVVVPTPAASTRIDRIVLRIDYTASPNTCVIARLAGVEGGAAPALTQTDGTTWEVSLAQVSITTGGVITVTDERGYVGDVGIPTAMLANDAVDDTKAGNRVPMLTRRQGKVGVDHWGGFQNGGTTDFTPTAVKMQCGFYEATVAQSSTGEVTITFAQAFSQQPVVLISQVAGMQTYPLCVNALIVYDGSYFKVNWRTAAGETYLGFYWLAIGPE